MKSVIALPAPPAAKPRTYPYLGSLRNSSLTVLFQSPRAGTVVKENGVFALGWSSTSWHEPSFTPFDGTVTLSND